MGHVRARGDSQSQGRTRRERQSSGRRELQFVGVVCSRPGPSTRGSGDVSPLAPSEGSHFSQRLHLRSIHIVIPDGRHTEQRTMDLHLLSSEGIPRKGAGFERRLVLGVALVSLALGAAACGGSSASNSGSTTTTSVASSSSSASTKASNSAFTACLKKNGVTLPSGGGAGSGGSTPGGGSIPSGSIPSGSAPTGSGGAPGSVPGGTNSKFQTALKACASLEPKGFGGGFGAGGTGGTNSAALAAYSNCLKLHGVALPTRPSSSSATSSTSTTLPSALDTSNPKVKAALSACASLRPTASTSTTTTTTPSS